MHGLCQLQGLLHQRVPTGVTLRPDHKLMRLGVCTLLRLLLRLAASCRCVLPVECDPTDGGDAPANSVQTDTSSCVDGEKQA